MRARARARAFVGAHLQVLRRVIDLRSGVDAACEERVLLWIFRDLEIRDVAGFGALAKLVEDVVVALVRQLLDDAHLLEKERGDAGADDDGVLVVRSNEHLGFGSALLTTV